MKRNYFLYRCLGLFLTAQFILLPQNLFAQKQAVPASTHQQMIQNSIRSHVVAQRQQRRQQMPYLDKGFINTAITPEKLEGRQIFISSGSKNLRDVIDRAKSVHTGARTARERVSLSRRRILVAIRELFPEMNIDWEDRTGKLSARPFNNMTYQISLRQPLFRGGILWNTLLQEKAGLEASKKEYEAVLLDMVNDVSAAYFEYSRTLQILRDQQKMTIRLKRFADISNQKFDEGIISEIEHLNVQSLYSQSQYDFETAKQEVDIAKLELQRYLDIDVGEDLDVAPIYNLEEILMRELENDEVDDPLLDQRDYEIGGEIEVPGLPELVDMAYQNRPELQVESARLEAARLEERVRWGEMMPRADLIFEFGKTGEAFDDVIKDPSMREDFRLQLEFSWNALGNTFGYNFERNEQAPSVSQFLSGTGSDYTRNNINVGILDGLQSLADAKEAEVDRLEQVEELEETEKDVVRDVKQAYYDYQKARIQVRSTIQRVNYRRRLTKLSEFRLQKNEIEISEYLQAEIDLLGELSTLHGALSDFFTAKAALNHAIGLTDHFSVEEQYES